KGTKPIESGMPGQVDQNVDTIIDDTLRQNRVRDVGHLTPMFYVSLETRSDVVFEGAIGVRMQVQTPVMAKLGQDRFKKTRDRMIAQIARHEPDLQPALRIRNVPVPRPMCPEAGLELLANPAVFAEQGVRVDLRTVAQDIQQIGITLLVVGG